MKASSRWPIVPLGEVVEQAQYGTSLRANEHGVGVPVLRMSNITYGGALDLTELKHVDLPPDERERYSVRRGDLLFNRTNSQDLVGKMGVWNRDEAYAFAGYLVRLRLKRSVADPAFVGAWFNTPDMKTLLRTRAKPSINMSNINASEVLQFPVVLPPLSEQRRIADVLDRAEALRVKRRATLAQLDTFTQALFLDLFGDPATNPKGWELKTVGALAAKFSDGPFGSNLKSSHYTDAGVRVVRLQNIGVGEFLDDDRAFISEDHFADLKKHECRPGDVLVGTLGDPNLRACIQPDWLAVALNKADCVQLRADGRIADPAYVCALLNQPTTERMAQELIVGQTRLRISMGRLRGLKVPCPPVSIQREFARGVAALEKLKTAHRTSLTEMGALFAALQRRAFRGDLNAPIE